MVSRRTPAESIIQKVREAEHNALYNEYDEQKGQLVTGVVQRFEGGAATVSLPNCEAILPRSEQIPVEAHSTTSACGPRCAKSASAAATSR